MNFLGMGPMELLLIVVLALIVFGPARLPKSWRRLAKRSAISAARQVSSVMSSIAPSRPSCRRRARSPKRPRRRSPTPRRRCMTRTRRSIRPLRACPRRSVRRCRANSRQPPTAPAARRTLSRRPTVSRPRSRRRRHWRTRASGVGRPRRAPSLRPRRRTPRRRRLPRPSQARPNLFRLTRVRPRRAPPATTSCRPTEPSAFRDAPRPSHTISAHRKERAVIEVFVESIRVNMTNYRRVVMLKEKTSPRYLPIWIGHFEADAIAIPMQNVPVQRPLTHDLPKGCIEQLGGKLTQVVINELADETFFAKLIVDANGRHVEVDARPSDAIALAIRAKVPIYVEESVFEQAGLVFENEETEGEVEAEEATEVDEEKLTVFKQFIETLDIDDLGKGGGGTEHKLS